MEEKRRALLRAEGKRIAILREEARLSRDDLAKILSIGSDMMGKIERGNREASRIALNILSKTFNTTINYILTGIDHNSRGMATNQSFVGMGKIADTPLAKSMFQTLHQLATKVDTIAVGIKKFDRIGNEFDNLKALQGTPSALSTNLEVRCALDDFRNCCSPVSKGLS